MSPRDVSTVIDRERCIGCGACVEACPSRTLAMQDGKAVVIGRDSLACGHCAALCPTGAITVAALSPEATRFETFAEAKAPAALEGLVALMRARRSCRAFKSDPVAIAVLHDLVKIGTTAPSGTNSQLWSFTILPDRASVEALGTGMAAFFAKLNKMSANPLMRGVSKLFMHDALGIYHREYAANVAEALGEYARGERDRLFHGAPAAIIVSMKPGASCGPEDALLASGQILLAAEAMGLASCLIGFAVEAFRHDKTLKGKVGIPREETVYAVVALGKAKLRFKRPAERLPLTPRVFQA